ncbi:MAG: hypothetical protein H8E14_17320 [Candidatus Marinimicrobia bacterium]|nr:hypothetical protein [Candidatus Neomarinimicrobiota bacterium]
MNVFKDLLNIWNQEDLLSQAWQESYEMLDISREMFTEAVSMLHKDSKRKKLIALKKRDKEINAYQKDVRRKVMTHFALRKENINLSSGMVLVNMVIDIERLGDYTKNILDLAIYHHEKLVAEEISPELGKIEKKILKRFKNTVLAIKTQDVEKAYALQKTYNNQVNQASDEIVNGILTGELKFGDETQTATIALYARYLKRIGAHLKNITSVLTNPVDTIGYKAKKDK